MALGEEPDLVEKDRPAIGGLEESDLRVARLAVRAAREAEELRFAEGLGNGAAVDGDERTRRSGSRVVEGTGEQSLAGSCLALNQHRRQAPAGPGAGQQLASAVLHLLEGGTATQQLD